MSERRGGRHDEAGAAVVDFVLVMLLLVPLFLGILQVGLVLHVRNTLTAAASEGARYAATVDRGPEEGAARAREQIRKAIFEGKIKPDERLSIERIEFLANIGLFVPLGMFLLLLVGSRLWLVALAAGIVLTSMIESVQRQIPGRVSDPRDVAANSIGMFVGIALAMVLTEVLQNAVEHGYGPTGEPVEGLPEGSLRGQIVVTVRRLVGRLHVSVDDDGRGLPAGFDLDGSTNLGLSIVRTLVESELGGQLSVGAAPAGTGTRAAIDIPLE